MKGARFRSAMRSVLSYLAEGLMWTGAPFGLSAAVMMEISIHMRRRRAEMVAERLREQESPGEPVRYRKMGIKPVTPLSRKECAEWAALVERLR